MKHELVTRRLENDVSDIIECYNVVELLSDRWFIRLILDIVIHDTEHLCVVESKWRKVESHLALDHCARSIHEPRSMRCLSSNGSSEL